MQLSVILPTLNRAKYLSRCIENIYASLASEHIDFEIIVVDGGSNDETREILSSSTIPVLRWISEKDKGAADSLNKGIRMARGEVIRYFSDDDEMIAGENVVFLEFLRNHPEIDVVVGHANYFRQDREGNLTPISILQPLGRFARNVLGFANEGCLTHEASFIRKSVFDDIGGYDCSFKYSFDVELWWRLLGNGKNIYVLGNVIVKRYLQPTSNSQIHGEVIFQEFARIFRMYRAWGALLKMYWFAKWKGRLDGLLLYAKGASTRADN